jgi:general secretion pathway protein G
VLDWYNRHQERLEEHESGFTLIELLVVITILGILAAIVVFSVTGLGSTSQTVSCKTDTETVQTAEQAYYANNNTDMYIQPISALTTAQFLSNSDTWHDVQVGTTTAGVTTWSPVGTAATGTTFRVVEADTTAPNPCAAVPGNPNNAVVDNVSNF